MDIIKWEYTCDGCHYNYIGLMANPVFFPCIEIGDIKKSDVKIFLPGEASVFLCSIFTACHKCKKQILGKIIRALSAEEVEMVIKENNLLNDKEENKVLDLNNIKLTELGNED